MQGSIRFAASRRCPCSNALCQKRVRREDEVVELVADHHTARVCESCLVLLTVHRRVHRMKVEKVIAEMAAPVPLVAEV